MRTKITNHIKNVLKNINWDWKKNPTITIAIEECGFRFTKKDVDDFISKNTNPSEILPQ